MESEKQQIMSILFEVFKQGSVTIAEQMEGITPELIEKFNQKFTLENPIILQLLESMTDICMDEELGPIFGGLGEYFVNKL